MLNNIVGIEMRMATDDDVHLPTYDNTKLLNINTCPTWGIIRYSKHLRMPRPGREMALEAGSAAHEGFAAIRWMQLHQRQSDTKIKKQIAENTGVKLFGEDRFAKMLGTLSNDATERTNTINFALESVYTSGFYDDPTDRNRSVSNISESLIAYVDRYDMDRYPIWIRDSTDPNSDVGIEIAFDIVIKFIIQEAKELLGITCDRSFRFTGKLDGLHYDKEHLTIIEEKTASGLSDAWLSQWIMSNQITGYCMAASTFTGLDCTRAIVSGTRLPIGKIPAEGIRKEPVRRNQSMFADWSRWFLSTVDVERTYINEVVKAPKYTHSCSRYFRTCSFLPFCAARDDEEKERILGEMEHDEWSPLDE